MCRALRPGGRIAVLDTRSFQSPLGTWLNPLVEGVAAYLTNWYPEADVVGAVGRTFDRTVVEEFHGGTVFVAHGEKGDPTRDRE
jgi:demethylmenaquinone methyltransferase/2-methoxy-6-polyprenyl-1,4-benzoquinol methylase